MNKSASFAAIFILTLATTSYSQDSQRPSHPESPSERPWTDSRRALETRQPNSERPPENSEFTISKQVDEVNLILSITDSKGRFVNDLTADDLKLFDNHKPTEKWNYFQARTNLPLHVILRLMSAARSAHVCISNNKLPASFLSVSCARKPIRQRSSLLEAPCRRKLWA